MSESETTKKTQRSSKLQSRFLNQVMMNSIAQQEFEGLNPSPEIRYDLAKIVSGELTSEQVASNIIKRIKK
jgi:hypothetical protein